MQLIKESTAFYGSRKFIYVYIYNTYIHTAFRFRALKQFCAKFGAQHRMVLELGRFGSHIRKTSKVVRCGAEEKWRISFRPIVSYMRNCQTQGEECPTYNKK